MSDFQAERETMIESQIRPDAVTNAALLKAMAETPREAFVPHMLRNLAYMDGPLRVEAARDGQAARYLLAPVVFAKLAQLATIRKTDRILDIAPATGYSSAVLARLGKEVVAVENDAGLTATARDAVAGQQIENVKFVTALFTEGAPDDGPFDVVFMNGRIEREPEELFPQIAPAGRLVAVMGSDAAPKARLFTRIGSSIQPVTSFDAGAPLLPGYEVKQKFSF